MSLISPSYRFAGTGCLPARPVSGLLLDLFAKSIVLSFVLPSLFQDSRKVQLVFQVAISDISQSSVVQLVIHAR